MTQSHKKTSKLVHKRKSSTKSIKKVFNKNATKKSKKNKKNSRKNIKNTQTTKHTKKTQIKRNQTGGVREYGRREDREHKAKGLHEIPSDVTLDNYQVFTRSDITYRRNLIRLNTFLLNHLKEKIKFEDKSRSSSRPNAYVPPHRKDQLTANETNKIVDLKLDTPNLIEANLPSWNPQYENHNFVYVTDKPTDRQPYFKDGLFHHPITFNDEATFVREYFGYVDSLIKEVNQPSNPQGNLQLLDYLITHDQKYKIGTEEKIIKIIGYPDPIKMNHVLTNADMMANIGQNKSQIDLYIKLYNALNPNDQIKDDKYKLLQSSYTELIEKNLIKMLIMYYGQDIGTKISNEVKKRMCQEINSKVDEQLQKPDIYIKYIFYIFVKGDSGKYKLLLNSIRELTSDHTPILKTIKELITTKLASKFKMVDPGKKYDNFYCYYSYGDPFHIDVEYIHPYTTIETVAHRYATRISLENLIYTSSLKSFWKNVSFQYPIRQYRLGTSSTPRSSFKSTPRSSSKSTPRSSSSSTQDIIDVKIIPKPIKTVILTLNKLLTSNIIEVYYEGTDDILYYLKLQKRIDPDLTHDKTKDKIKERSTILSIEGQKIDIWNSLNSVFAVTNCQEITENTPNPFNVSWSIPLIKFTRFDIDYFQTKIMNEVTQQYSQGNSPGKTQKQIILNKCYNLATFRVLRASAFTEENKVDPITTLTDITSDDTDLFSVDDKTLTSLRKELIYDKYCFQENDVWYQLITNKIQSSNENIKFVTWVTTIPKELIEIETEDRTENNKLKTDMTPEELRQLWTYNKVNGLYDIPSPVIIQKVFDRLKQLGLFSKYPTYRLYVNNVYTLIYNTLHFQFLDSQDSYQSWSYGEKTSLGTENRLTDAHNLLSFANANPNYLTNLKDNVSLFTSYSYYTMK